MIKYVFICDGCEKEEISMKPSMPMGFADVSVRITGLSNPYIDIQNASSSLLCGACQNHFCGGLQAILQAGTK